MQDEPTNPVKAYRKASGEKLRDLAKRWGTSFATLSRIENGKQRVPENILPVVSEDTGVPAKELRPDLAERSEKLTEILAEPVQ